MAYAWSRRLRTSSFGDSGLPVFQAGHCDWQRPHSVQVVKSSRPFQVNCSTWATPNWSFSGSASSKSSGLPWLIIGRSAPRPEPAGLAGSRLKKMLGNARKRCQATPMVTFREMTISQVIEMMILMAAATLTPSAQSGSTAPTAWLTGVAQNGNSKWSVATLKPRIRNPKIRTSSTIHSTK